MKKYKKYKKPNLPSKPVHLDELHVVDEGVTMLPGFLTRAGERPGDHNLDKIFTNKQIWRGK